MENEMNDSLNELFNYPSFPSLRVETVDSIPSQKDYSRK